MSASFARHGAASEVPDTGLPTPMLVVGYCRLSKSEDGHGIAVQQRAIEEHCARQGFELLRFEVDNGASGRSTRKRPGLARAIEACEREGCRAIVSTRIDRLARSSLDLARLIEHASRHGFNLLCSEQGFDLQTPEGKLLASLLGSFAAFEADLISARTTAALAHVKRHGSRSGRPIGNPGFVSVSAETGARILELREAGLSYRRIADQLNGENVPTVQGGKRWHARTVWNIVSRMTSQITASSTA